VLVRGEFTCFMKLINVTWLLLVLVTATTVSCKKKIMPKVEDDVDFSFHE